MKSCGKICAGFKRTPFILKVGNPFTIDLHGERMNKEVSQMVVDEMMWQIAALLPPYYRGVMPISARRANNICILNRAWKAI